MYPVKNIMEEFQYLLDNDFIESGQSDWSSPCYAEQNLKGHLACIQTTEK
jgi:hypothetical protein